MVRAREIAVPQAQNVRIVTDSKRDKDAHMVPHYEGRGLLTTRDFNELAHHTKGRWVLGRAWDAIEPTTDAARAIAAAHGPLHVQQLWGVVWVAHSFVRKHHRIVCPVPVPLALVGGESRAPIGTTPALARYANAAVGSLESYAEDWEIFDRSLRGIVGTIGPDSYSAHLDRIFRVLATPIDEVQAVAAQLRGCANRSCRVVLYEQVFAWCTCDGWEVTRPIGVFDTEEGAPTDAHAAMRSARAARRPIP